MVTVKVYLRSSFEHRVSNAHTMRHLMTHFDASRCVTT